MNQRSIMYPLACFSILALLGGCAGGADPDQGTNISTNESLQNTNADSRCTESATQVTCTNSTTVLGLRTVLWQIPLGTAPEGGWPTVLMFQGSFFSAALSWQATSDLPFGAYYQTLVIKRLLDHGFAVITPEAHGEGLTFWDTNNPLWANNWSAAPDNQFMLDIFSAIDAGKFGPLRGTRMYATGISSGGYMTSRVGLSYPGRFVALGIESASYETCAGPICNIPALPASHPPTLLLHGQEDTTVPLSTAELYRDRLNAAGVENQLIVHDPAGHQWIPEAPDAVLAWFVNHP